MGQPGVTALASCPPNRGTCVPGPGGKCGRFPVTGSPAAGPSEMAPSPRVWRGRLSPWDTGSPGAWEEPTALSPQPPRPRAHQPSLNLITLCPESVSCSSPACGWWSPCPSTSYFSVIYIHHLPCMDVLMPGQGFLSQSALCPDPQDTWASSWLDSPTPVALTVHRPELTLCEHVLEMSAITQLSILRHIIKGLLPGRVQCWAQRGD